MECHLNRWPHYGTQHCQAHFHSLIPQGQSQNGLGMFCKAWKLPWRHTVLTLEVRSSGQAWRSHVLEVKQFWQVRVLKTHSLLTPYLPSRKIAFPLYCGLSDIHCLKMLAGLLSLTNSPEPETIAKVPILTGNGKPRSKCLFHHVFPGGQIQRAQACLEISGKLWGHTMAVNLDIGP